MSVKSGTDKETNTSTPKGHLKQQKHELNAQILNK